MGRVLGVDLGSRRIGLALSDEGRTTASPLEVLERTGDRSVDHEAIVTAAVDHDADMIVVGLPLALDGTKGTAARRVLTEVDELRRVAGDRVRIDVHDERLSTVSAQRALVDAGMRRERRRQTVDKVAAAVILQSWLDARAAS